MISEKKAYQSFIQALDADTAVLDSRSELDRLSFLADYASLINFYNQENKVHGTWKPLLMKDPVFLLADIAKFNVTRIQKNTLRTSHNLEHLIATDASLDLIGTYLNQLIQEFTGLFLKLERWAHYMDKYHQDYALKKFLIGGVQSTFGAKFFALASWSKKLEQENLIPQIKQIDPSFLDSIDKDLCKKANKPFWEVLSLDESEFVGEIRPDESALVQQVFTSAQSLIRELLEFFQNAKAHAGKEYQSLAAIKGKYPDTALLRSFVKLQEIHRQSLNSLAEKHLNFYYEKVLGQTKRKAQADRVFVTAKLNASTSTFELAKGTRFNAGDGSDHEPIEFATRRSVNLNSAKILNGYSLCRYSNRPNNRSLLYKTPLKKPDLLKKDKKGSPLSWKLFGGEPVPTSTQESTAFVVGSPLLFLKEGQRVISCEMTFESEVDQELFKTTNYYLSTGTSWLPLDMSQSQYQTTDASKAYGQCIFSTESGNQLTLEITLGSKVAGIKPFTKNPEGITCLWPMLKLEFDQFGPQDSPPVLTEMKIDVKALGLHSFELYNDFGALNPKKAFPLLGPTPMPNSSFMIGSKEIFSKPLTTLNFDLEWEGLPDNFQTYYLEYNVNGELVQTFAPGTTPEQALQELQAGPFNNACFTAQFEVLQNKRWLPLGATGEQVLFSSDQNGLQNVRSFSFGLSSPDWQPNANLQLAALEFDDEVNDGFARLRLTGPEEGFGSEMYGKVVSNVALKNAQKLMNKQAPSFPQANVPFVPKLKSLRASYNASQVYRFDFAPTAEPICCYVHAMGQTKQVYSNLPEPFNPTGNSTYTLDGKLLVSNRLSLYPSLENRGALFLSVSDLSTPGELNVYFELARKVGVIPAREPITFRFQYGSEWLDLKALSDDTKGFTCSGIVKLSVPELSTREGLLCIGVLGDPDLYAHATLVDPNGIELERVGENFLDDPDKPYLKAGSIKEPTLPIPQLASVKQPFGSFAGLGAENRVTMNCRVATHVKTKQRFTSSTDYYQLIQHHFPEIYYSKCIYDRQSKKTQVLVVRYFEDEYQHGAFSPMIDINLEEQLQAYIQQNSSAFAHVSVSNFTPYFVSISATVTMDNKHGLGQAQTEINNRLKLFLSPWISSDTAQIPIDNGLTKVQVLNFIRSIDGVVSVSDIAIEKSLTSSLSDAAPEGSTDPSIQLSMLLVTSGHHEIKCRHAI